jgi:hypothetical protein
VETTGHVTSTAPQILEAALPVPGKDAGKTAGRRVDFAAHGPGAGGGTGRRRELRLGSGPAVPKLQLSPAHSQLSFPFALLRSRPGVRWGPQSPLLLLSAFFIVRTASRTSINILIPRYNFFSRARRRAPKSHHPRCCCCGPRDAASGAAPRHVS